ncbi:pyridoxamine 5'-phosphate oxidase family protein [Amycolatopsis xylanica]|uniref:Pyridoxamine 5'-phosphate oxidase family protein n=1 Tax=Amycolatopsis xylanica TaxID=589385 RepID=A0A1H3RXC2_9PSEU|nr:PPOX class F420-dependent oxidoreductase [Amycolatopsis xylanica]SDZ29968.1 pyridoxamine 5'-phosphate oxidase family protein [Amycolatopsis xylanica]
MIFTETEREYLKTLALGRLATIGPAGAPQNHPVTYFVNDDGTIDIGGPALSRSQKYRNIQADPRASLVVDDTASEPVGPGGQRGRGIEIRGDVEVLLADVPLLDGFSNDVVRIHPRRVVAWNLDGPGANNRDV